MLSGSKKLIDPYIAVQKKLVGLVQEEKALQKRLAGIQADIPWATYESRITLQSLLDEQEEYQQLLTQKKKEVIQQACAVLDAWFSCALLDNTSCIIFSVGSADNDAQSTPHFVDLPIDKEAKVSIINIDPRFSEKKEPFFDTDTRYYASAFLGVPLEFSTDLMKGILAHIKDCKTESKQIAVMSFVSPDYNDLLRQTVGSDVNFVSGTVKNMPIDVYTPLKNEYPYIENLALTQLFPALIHTKAQSLSVFRPDLNKRYSKFCHAKDSNDVSQLKKQINALFENYECPRGGWFLSLHWSRSHLDESNQLRKNINSMNSLVQIQEYLYSINQSLTSSYNKQKQGSYLRRIQYALCLADDVGVKRNSVTPQ
jgi:hypothetical protein